MPDKADTPAEGERSGAAPSGLRSEATRDDCSGPPGEARGPEWSLGAPKRRAANRASTVTPNPGLAALLAEARETWIARAHDQEAAAPGWRPFEDAFPTFYQFTNRPR
jgi:hypothetical protein